MPSAAPNKALKLRDRAYESFTTRLLARDIRAGQFISQRELAVMTGLSLGAIRELVPRLEGDGLIKTVPQRGMQICHVDMELVRNAFQFRLFLEREAAALFAVNASDETLAQMRKGHETIIRRAERQVTPAVVADAQLIDNAMHDAVIDSLGNAIISNAYRVNAIKIRLIRQEQTRLEPSLVVPVIREHLGIIEAFGSRNPERAAAAIGSHIMNARARALSAR
jgi:DNA-binding GntR family transcriptional regulator